MVRITPFVIVVTMVAVVVAISTTALAQPVTTLSSFSLAQVGGSVVRAQFDFTPNAPQYRIDGNGTAQISINFFGTVKRPTVSPSPVGLGALKGIDMRENGNVVAFVFNGNGPLRLQAVPSPHSIALLITSAAPADNPAASSTAALGGTEVSVIRLRHADVNEVAAILGSSLLPDPLGQNPPALQPSSGLLTGGLGAQNVQGVITGASSAPPVALKVSESVSVDRRLNAVIITGPSSVAEPLKRLIEAIDTPVPSVLLEVSVVELTDTAARDLGIDFSNGVPLATVSATVKSGQLPQGQLSLQASIYGAVQKGYGRIIARPRILVESGTPASILTGDSIPIFTNISYPGSGSNIIQQQVQYVNVGVSLQIAATVDETDVVHSRVQSSVSSVTGFVQGVPQISQRQATTNANVRNGSSLVIGGLVQESELSSTTSVPGLSALPIVGSLFKVRHATKQHTDLYIIITPTVTRR